jgi:hypothetical protein
MNKNNWLAIFVMMGSLFKSGRSHHFLPAAHRDCGVEFRLEPIA